MLNPFFEWDSSYLSLISLIAKIVKNMIASSDIKRPRNDVVEIFGFSPIDVSSNTRRYWDEAKCPFTKKGCVKYNSQNDLCYGVCSVTSTLGDCIVCPNRLYAEEYSCLKNVALDAFGDDIEIMLYDDYLDADSLYGKVVVAFGKNSGKEVKIGSKLSMDWVLALLINNELKEYVGVEVQSIDTTNNYRSNWKAYRQLDSSFQDIPKSEHGMNWANVQKRLIPQLIRKTSLFKKSKNVKRGFYFILPDVVFKKFEILLGEFNQEVCENNNGILNIHTYDFNGEVKSDGIKEIILKRSVRIRLEDFVERFLNGSDLPSGEVLDIAVLKKLR